MDKFVVNLVTFIAALVLVILISSIPVAIYLWLVEGALVRVTGVQGFAEFSFWELWGMSTLIGCLTTATRGSVSKKVA